MSEVEPVVAPARSWPRWLWLVLIASLAANLFVVGAFTRALWPGRYATAHHGPGGFFGNLAAYTRTLPEERRMAVRQGLGRDQVQQKLKPLRVEVRSARQEAARLFKAQPFERTAFLAAEGRVQESEARLRQAIIQLAVEMASRMTADERAGFLQWRDAGRPGAGRGGAHADRDGEGTAAPKKPVE